MENILFGIIIAIIVFDFVVERILQYLNITWRNKPIPTELEGIYDEEKYKKQQDYSKVNSKFSVISSTFSFIILIAFLLLNGFVWLNELLNQYIENELIIGLSFFGILYITSDLLSLPFSIYDTFVIEQKFGFNKTTPKTFVFDKLKGYLITVILGGALYAIIFKFYEKTDSMFWIYGWVIITVVLIFFSMFYSNLIVPLFNKQKPLSNNELKEAIERFSKKVNFKIDNIYEIDGSKRSTRANAYFTGFGPKKRIVLYDTLIKELSIGEIVAVLAHEIGHNKHKHTIIGLLLSIVQMGIMFFILSVFISNPMLSNALGVTDPSFHISLVAFALLYSPISTITSLFMNVLSRKNEYQADAFVKDNSNSEDLISALKKLTKNNLSNLTPHPVYVWVNYSHPTLLQRIKKLL